MNPLAARAGVWAARLGRRSCASAAAGLLTFLFAPSGALAGQACESKAPSVKSVAGAIKAAERMRENLDESGSSVAIIGRQGQDLSKYGLKYSHVGFAYKAPGKAWVVKELLNDCGSAKSDIWVDGLGAFFNDDPFTLDSVMLIPSKAIEAKLAEELADADFLEKLHEPRYSMVAYPFSDKYQNSNQWVLEVLAVAEASVKGVELPAKRSEIQAWLRSTRYVPTELGIGTMERLGGRVFKANVAFDDHPNELRFASRIQTVTVESIIAFVQSSSKGWHGMKIPGPRDF